MRGYLARVQRILWSRRSSGMQQPLQGLRKVRMGIFRGV